MRRNISSVPLIFLVREVCKGRIVKPEKYVYEETSFLTLANNITSLKGSYISFSRKKEPVPITPPEPTVCFKVT